MGKLDKYKTGKVIAEDKEYVKTANDQIIRIKDAPTHNDNIIATELGNKKVKPGKGGILLNNVKSVLSATHENRNSKDRLYTQKDEEIKIMPKEAEMISESVNLPIPKQHKGISPAKLLDQLIEKRTSTLRKYEDLNKPQRFSKTRFNALKANKAVLATIPSVEDLYDTVFEYSESKKKDSDVNNYAQTGKPLYVSSKNDPRYKTYQDSLTLYNLTKAQVPYKEKISNGTNLTKIQLEDLLSKTPEFGAREIKARDRLQAEPIKTLNYKFNSKDNIKMRGAWSEWKKPNQTVLLRQPLQKLVPVIPYKNTEIANTIENDFNTNIETNWRIPSPDVTIETIPGQKIGYDEVTSTKYYPDPMTSKLYGIDYKEIVDRLSPSTTKLKFGLKQTGGKLDKYKKY